MRIQAPAPAEATSGIVVSHDAGQVQEVIDSLSVWVNDRYQDPNTFFLSLLNGGPVFSVPLMTRVYQLNPSRHPVVRYMQIESYDENLQPCPPRITQPLSLSSAALVAGNEAVILDEMLDGGGSAELAEQYLYDLGATAVSLVVLAQKDRPRQVWENATKYGLLVPDNWAVGKGMNGAPGEVEEAYRFADFIGYVPEH